MPEAASRTRPRRRALRAAGLSILAVAAGTVPLAAGSFFTAGFDFGLDSVSHPAGYTGTGGSLTVELCIDPASANKNAMQTAVQNVVNTVNGLTPTTGNLSLGGSNNIPSGQIDFESALLHELVHCLGLGHTNVSTESGLTCQTVSSTCTTCNDCDRDFTKSTDGVDDDPDVDTPTDYNLDDGTDNVIGTGDDSRGDDDNLHWFRKSDNNPFTIAGTVDSSTYSRNLADLPGADTYAANGTRCVANELLSSCDTEAVMKQGAFLDEAQRTLAHDDVAMLRYGMSGLDETAGTGDDYTFTLSFIGESDTCDIVITMETSVGFAFCSSSFSSISGSDHFRMVNGVAKFESTANWFFNDQSNCSIDQTLDLTSQTISNTQTFEACDRITADTFTVTSTGDVTFRAGKKIILEDGFNVESGGTFVAEIDPGIN